MAKQNESELLKLLNSRRAWSSPQHRQPRWNDKDRAEIETAALLHAQVNASDPFAYGRIKNLLLQGVEFAHEVAKDARDRLAARQIASAIDEAA